MKQHARRGRRGVLRRAIQGVGLRELTLSPTLPPPATDDHTQEATCAADLEAYELEHGLAERCAALMSAALLAQPPELLPFIAAEAARVQVVADVGV